MTATQCRLLARRLFRRREGHVEAVWEGSWPGTPPSTAASTCASQATPKINGRRQTMLCICIPTCPAAAGLQTDPICHPKKAKGSSSTKICLYKQEICNPSQVSSHSFLPQHFCTRAQLSLHDMPFLSWAEEASCREDGIWNTTHKGFEKNHTKQWEQEAEATSRAEGMFVRQTCLSSTKILGSSQPCSLTASNT